jgi:thiol-disulfide isomerase/thioredoxin
MSLSNRRSIGCLLLVALLGLGVSRATPGQADKPKEELPRLTYAQLGQFVHDQKGKVVYVDFWQFGCIPCKKGMPDLARLQEKYRDKGFLAVTVNLDDPAKPELAQQALGFIGNEKIQPSLKVLTNFQLNETPEFTQNTLGFTSVPRGYLFDGEGRRVEKYTDGVKHEELEKRVSELLERK